MNYDLHENNFKRKFSAQSEGHMEEDKPVIFNIIYLKAYHHRFMSLTLFYFIIVIIATTQFLSNQTV